MSFACAPGAPRPSVRRLPDLLDSAAATYGDAPFLLRHDSWGWGGYSFAEAARAMHAFAALLREQGVVPGARVGLQSENRPEWGLAYLAIMACGAVAVPLDAQLREREVGEILDRAGATHGVASARQIGVLRSVRDSRLRGLGLIALDVEGGLPSWPEAMGRAEPAPLRARFPAAEPGPSTPAGVAGAASQAEDAVLSGSDRPGLAPPVIAEDALAPGAYTGMHGGPEAPDDALAALIFTSGTTGQPKGVMLSHANLLFNVEAVARTLDFGQADRMLSVLPLHHTFESTVGFLSPLRCGASVAYARGFKSNELREDLRTSGATILLVVPLLLEKLLGAIRRAIADAPRGRRLLVHGLLGLGQLLRRTTGIRVGAVLFGWLRERSGMGSVRMFVPGAAPLAPEVFWGLTDFGWMVLEGYGLTECSPVVSVNRPGSERPGNVGWPVPGVEVRIANPADDGNGEVAIRGHNVMLGYHDDPAATSQVLRDGWLHTGDLGRIDRAGRLKITGRLKNMIATSAGKKIYPEEIETQLGNSPYILEAVVTGGRDARGEREEVHAHLVPDLAAVESLARARGRVFDDAFIEEVLRVEVEGLGRELAPYKRVKRLFVRRQEFDKTTTGKIRRQAVAAPRAPVPEAGLEPASSASAPVRDSGSQGPAARG